MQFPFPRSSYVENVYQGSSTLLPPFLPLLPRGILRRKRRWIPRAKPESYSNPVELNRGTTLETFSPPVPRRNLSFSFDRVTRVHHSAAISRTYGAYFSPLPATDTWETRTNWNLPGNGVASCAANSRIPRQQSFSPFSHSTLNYYNLFLFFPSLFYLYVYRGFIRYHYFYFVRCKFILSLHTLNFEELL